VENRKKFAEFISEKISFISLLKTQLSNVFYFLKI